MYCEHVHCVCVHCVHVHCTHVQCIMISTLFYLYVTLSRPYCYNSNISYCILQIYSFGGPHHQTIISYTIDNNTVANVDQTGLITAIVPGFSIVTGNVIITHYNTV